MVIQWALNICKTTEVLCGADDIINLCQVGSWQYTILNANPAMVWYVSPLSLAAMCLKVT